MRSIRWSRMFCLFVLPVAMAACGGDSPTTPATPVPTPVPPLAAPSGLTAEAGSRQVDLQWTGSSGATGYRVYRDGAAIADVTATTHTDTSVRNNRDYCYTVRAFDATRESVDSNMVCVTPAPDYSGFWSGSTSQGRLISFQVSDNSVSSLAISVVAQGGGCTVTSSVTFTSSYLIENDQFQISSSGFLINGTFTSESGAQGTAVYTVTSGWCAGLQTTMTWTASKS